MVADLAGQVGAERTELEAVVQPGIVFMDMGQIVVAILVARMQDTGFAVLEVVVEVVLDAGPGGSEIPLGKVVQIDEVVTAQQVGDFLVVLGPVEFRIQSAVQFVVG